MKQFNKCSPLETLFSRGYQVEVTNGLLNITPPSNKSIPEQWLSDNRENIINEIARLSNNDIYVYDSYSTGRYGKHKSAGMTLQFVNLSTGEQCHVTYNVELKRSRTTKKGKKGDDLPKGQFRVTNKFRFYKFWQSTGLKLPPRLSAFHDYMGNLKNLYFIPAIDYKQKITGKIIPLFSVTHNQLLSYLAKHGTYSSQTTGIQQPYKEHTILTNKVSSIEHVNKELSSNQSTWETKCELRYQGNGLIRSPLPIAKVSIRPEEQSNDEWLNEYDNS